MTHPERVTLPLEVPLDLRLTLAAVANAGGDPSMKLRPNEARWAFESPDGDVTLHARVEGADPRSLVIDAWGDGAGWALERAPGLFGLLDDAEVFEPDHEGLRAVRKKVHGLRYARTYRLTDLLWPIVLGQLVKSAEKARAYRILTARYGRDAPGPLALRLPPRPARLAGLRIDDLLDAGALRKQAEVVRFVCKRHKRLDALARDEVDSATVRERLLAFPGIGPWTAALALMCAFGDPDAVPVGDYHIPNTVTWFFAGEDRGDDARMLELLEPFRGNRGRVIRWLEHAGVHAPRYGAKRAMRPLRRG